MEVTQRQGVNKERLVHRLCGFGPDADVRAHNSNLINLLRGLVERLYLVESAEGLAPPPKPQRHVFAERLSSFKQLLLRHMPKAVRVDRKTLLGYYSGRQRAVYEKAVDSLALDPVCKADAQVKTFVKAEKINFKTKPDPAPRIIQPRNPRYNVEVGRYLRPLEKRVYRAIAKVWGGTTVLKLNASQQATELRRMWDSFERPVAVGLDASRFDQHVSADALRWEHSVYTAVFSGDDRAELERLLSWQVHNKGVAYTPTARVKYSVEGARMSGDINTSLGNCLLMCAMVWAYCRACGVKARLANNGDDCIVIMDKCHLDSFRTGLEAWFCEMGFTMKVEEPVETFELIEFCQMKPVRVPGGWRMVRTFDRAIAKDTVSLLDLSTGFQAYLGAVGDCGLAVSSGIPVYQSFYASMRASGKPSNIMGHGSIMGGLRYLASGMAPVVTEVTPETRASFAVAFGVLPDEQVALERWLHAHPIDPHLRRALTPLVGTWYK